MLRWGNYDVVHAACSERFEIPTAAVPFVNGNPVPATHSLPSSFYLTTNRFGGARCLGLRLARMLRGTGPGGFAYAIPAQACYKTPRKMAAGY